MIFFYQNDKLIEYVLRKWLPLKYFDLLFIENLYMLQLLLVKKSLYAVLIWSWKILKCCFCLSLKKYLFLPCLLLLGKRRRSSLLPVLTRLASVGLLGSVSSSADLTKEAASNDTSDEEDSAVEITSRPNSNYSNYSSDCLSLARTVSTGSSVSAFPASTSLENLVHDNLAYVDEKPPNYREVSNETKAEDVRNLFLLEFIVW